MAHEKELIKIKSSAISDNDLKELLKILNSLDHGSVTLVIHDSRIVKIEKNEKVFLE